MKSNKTRLATILTLILVFFGILIILRLSFFNTDTKNKIAVSSRANGPPTCTSGFYVNEENTDGSGCAAACGKGNCQKCLWGGNERYECKNAASLPSCSKPRTYASFDNCEAEHTNESDKCTQCKIGETPRWEYGGKGPKLATPSPPTNTPKPQSASATPSLSPSPTPTATPSLSPSPTPTGTNKTQNTYRSTCVIPPGISVDDNAWKEVECGHILISDQNGKQIFRECPGPFQEKSCKYSCYVSGKEVECDSPLRSRKTLFHPRNMTVLNNTGESITLSGGISNGDDYHNKLFNNVILNNGDYVTASYYSCVDKNFVSIVYNSSNNTNSNYRQDLDCDTNSMLIELKSGE
ncbi:hypothetical protein H3C65_03905 [Patescibacteria group bacterium]|nr:hypothetical protein [Patescibacteria group bacterium]